MNYTVLNQIRMSGKQHKKYKLYEIENNMLYLKNNEQNINKYLQLLC